MFAIEDPHDPKNNVGKGIFQILTIKTVFLHAYRTLVAASSPFDLTALSRILTVDPVMLSYRTYVKSLYSHLVKETPKQENIEPNKKVEANHKRKEYEEEQRSTNKKTKQQKEEYPSRDYRDNRDYKDSRDYSGRGNYNRERDRDYSRQKDSYYGNYNDQRGSGTKPRYSNSNTKR